MMKIVFYIEDGDFWDICFDDLHKCTDVKIIRKSERFNLRNRIIKKLCGIHNSDTLNRYVSVPFRNIWKKADLLEQVANKKELECFVFTDTSIRNVTQQTLRDIQNAGNKLVLFFLNPTRNQQDTNCALAIAKKVNFDGIYTIDQEDAYKFGYTYCNCCYSRHEMKKEKESIDILYVGKDKNRLDTILNFATNTQEYNCRFYITGVPVDKQRKVKNVIYGNGIPYLEVLNLVNQSKCILECVQEGQKGLTFRFYEAICYNKKLITNNPFVEQLPCFDKDYMYVIGDEDVSLDEFINDKKMPQYNYLNEFSPTHFVEKIRADIEPKKQ